ncbi:hypothetical protein NDU88_001701 [Pleurodeles waltl]|uniref:Uncharacterized protein n=1 Tax=Pleurodeles waltl TaxID=8319 RepID=A0AAV7VZQ0_PLEWA|nr:hypothetical protein NDU88_001701 [Pleurodeles waltl]
MMTLNNPVASGCNGFDIGRRSFGHHNRIRAAQLSPAGVRSGPWASDEFGACPLPLTSHPTPGARFRPTLDSPSAHINPGCLQAFSNLLAPAALSHKGEEWARGPPNHSLPARSHSPPYNLGALGSSLSPRVFCSLSVPLRSAPFFRQLTPPQCDGASWAARCLLSRPHRVPPPVLVPSGAFYGVLVSAHPLPRRMKPALYFL